MESENELGEFLTQLALVSDVDKLEEKSESVSGHTVTLMTLHAVKGLEFPVVFMAGLEEGIFPHQRSLNSSSEMEEERRLMYVGVTRAEELLFLTYAKRRLIWGDYKYFTPSRFLSEIPPQLFLTNNNSGKEKSYNSGGESYVPAICGAGRPNQVNRKDNYQHESGKIDLVSSFGKNFVVPKITKKKDVAVLEKKIEPVSLIEKEEAVLMTLTKETGDFEEGDRVFS